MKLHRIAEHAIYVVIVVLSLAALWLMLKVPADFLKARVIYGGF